MVTGSRAARDAETAGADLILRVDGGRPLSAETVAALGAACDRAEDNDPGSVVIVYVSGVPEPGWASGLSVAVVNRWERGLRRLERLPAVTIAVADGDCGGSALDALLAADYRIMATWAKLVVPVVAGAPWPGMALYRLARQAAGAAQARRAALFGTPIGAVTAQAIGLIDEVADDVTGSLHKAAAAAAVTRGPDLAIRRQLMLEAPATAFEEALGTHLAACDRALRHAAPGVA